MQARKIIFTKSRNLLDRPSCRIHLSQPPKSPFLLFYFHLVSKVFLFNMPSLKNYLPIHPSWFIVPHQVPDPCWFILQILHANDTWWRRNGNGKPYQKIIDNYDFFLLFFLIISLSSADFDHAWSGFLSLQIEIASWWRSHWKSCKLLKWNCKTWFNFGPKCIFHCSFKNLKKTSTDKMYIPWPKVTHPSMSACVKISHFTASAVEPGSVESVVM